MSRGRRSSTVAAVPVKHRHDDMWRHVLEDYDQRHCCNGEEQIAWFQKHQSVRAAIETAARATDERGRRYSHQFRIRRNAIAQATAALLAVEEQIARATTFCALLNIITEQLQDVDGVGKLYCYDTAFRIGAYRRLFPERVYLHAGTRLGARALGLDYKKDALQMREVPAPLRHRKAYEIEDILCIYKDRFSAHQNATTARRQFGRSRGRDRC